MALKDSHGSNEDEFFDPQVFNKFGARRLSRIFVVQGLYHQLISKSNLEAIEEYIIEQAFFQSCDEKYFFDGLRKISISRDALEVSFKDYLNVSLDRISPVEHSVILLPSYELLHKLDIAPKIIINEAIEIDKLLGGNQGHRLVNGVLDRMATDIRRKE